MYYAVRILIEAALTALLFGCAFVIVSALWRMVSKPPSQPRGAELFTVVAAAGRAEQLEQMVTGLLWLRDSGELCSRVIIVDSGLNPDARMLAELLSKDSRVTLCAPEELSAIMEECEWKRSGEGTCA